jgi:hypothetical protein
MMICSSRAIGKTHVFTPTLSAPERQRACNLTMQFAVESAEMQFHLDEAESNCAVWRESSAERKSE